jgi:hypothetical protein
MVKLQPETSRLIRRILAWKLISIARQPVLLAASRRCLIQMLRSPIDLNKWPFLLVTRGEE